MKRTAREVKLMRWERWQQNRPRKQLKHKKNALRTFIFLEHAFCYWCDLASREHRLVGGGGGVSGFASYRAQTYIKWKLLMSRLFLRICKAFRCAPKIFWLMAKNKFLLFGFRQNKSQNVQYLQKFFFDFKKWGLKWKLIVIIAASYFMQKN